MSVRKATSKARLKDFEVDTRTLTCIPFFLTWSLSMSVSCLFFVNSTFLKTFSNWNLRRHLASKWTLSTLLKMFLALFLDFLEDNCFQFFDWDQSGQSSFYFNVMNFWISFVNYLVYFESFSLFVYFSWFPFLRYFLILARKPKRTRQGFYVKTLLE